MRILHTADIHIGEFPGPERGGENCRLRDTLNCMEYLHEKAVEELPDIILISGDLFHRAKLWGDEMLAEVQAAIDWLLKLSEVAPVCLLYGTPNHDNIEAFKTLRKALPYNVYIFTEPEMKTIPTLAGIIQVCGLPGFDRGYFRARYPGISREEENQTFTKALGDAVLGLKVMCSPQYPSVLMAHYTVPGANMESGQIQLLTQSEPMILPEVLDAAGFDLVALGHIHRPQKLVSCQNTFYSGAINAFNFNDEGQERGFWIHELDGESVFHKTPYRELVTFKFADTDIVGINTGEIDAVAHNWWNWESGSNIKDKIVRILYSCSEEANKAFNKALLEKRLYDDGAFWVSEITPEQITISANRDEFSEHSAPEDNLRDYLLEKAYPDEKIASVMEAARPIIAEAGANNSVSRLSGMFEPLEIEVKNYRNYVDERFDFRDISFCTINGKNGAGKSSLFSDAIVDCLFEEPRESELTGWIRQSDDARSGAITFTFRIGDRTFRVSRTRAKSGKATLALSELIDGSWLNRSKERFKDTQDEIINVIGMDSLTLRSCALIMQNQYGLFLEKDKGVRMDILSKLLGLGIYKDMEALARDRAAELGREVRGHNIKLELMADGIKNAGDIEAAAAGHEREIERLTEDKKQAEAITDSLRLRLLSKTEASARSAKLRDEITALTVKHTNSTALLTGQRSAFADAGRFLLREPEIIDGVTGYHALLEREKELLAGKATYDAKKQEVEALNAEIRRLSAQSEAFCNEEKGLYAKLTPLNAKLNQKDFLAAKAATHTAAKERLAILEAAGEKWLALRNELVKLQQHRAAMQSAYESEYASRSAVVRELKGKALLLENSGCIDAENARCAFLKDAQEAKARLEPYSAECREWKEAATAKFHAADADITAKQNEITQLGYDAEAVSALRREVAALEQAARDYSALHGYEEQSAMINERLVAVSNSKSEITDTLLPHAENVYKEALGRLAELETAMHAYTDLQSNIEREKHWLDEEKQLPVARERQDAARARIDELERELASLSADINQKQTGLAIEEETAAGGEALTIELSEAEKCVASCEYSLKNHYGELGYMEKHLEQIKETNIAMKELRGEIQRISEAAAIMDELKSAFSQDGIPHNIIRSIIPVLTATANNILSQMTAGRMGMSFVTEKTLKSNNKKEVVALDILIEEYGGKSMSYDSKSGGEKVKAALSAILALAEIKSSRAGIQLGMLFIDEPPYLDGDGIQAYCDALETIQRRYSGLKVMAITHDPSMKARFPQSLDVVKDKAGSRVIYE